MTTPCHSALALVSWSAWGFFGDSSTSANLRTEDSTSITKPSQKVMRRRLPFSSPFSRMQPGFTRTLQPIVQYALCPDLTEHSLIFLWLRHVIITALPMSLRTLVNIPSRVVTPLTETDSSVKHSVFCSILNRISHGHQYPDDPFAALVDFKVILEKATGNM